jgi:hypothetical protein
MRYTQRKKNIEFLDSSEVKQAMTLLDDLLKIPTPHHFEHTMKANQGLIQCQSMFEKKSASQVNFL